MRLFMILTSTALMLYFFNKFLLWLEANGWLYYRRRKAQSDVSATALLEMSTHISPGNQHTIKMLEEPQTKELEILKSSNASNDTEYHA